VVLCLASGATTARQKQNRNIVGANGVPETPRWNFRGQEHHCAGRRKKQPTSAKRTAALLRAPDHPPIVIVPLTLPISAPFDIGVVGTESRKCCDNNSIAILSSLSLVLNTICSRYGPPVASAERMVGYSFTHLGRSDGEKGTATANRGVARDCTRPAPRLQRVNR
jgi:hypothetical protein